MTSTLCAATFSNSYIQWRLRYVMLRFVAAPFLCTLDMPVYKSFVLHPWTFLSNRGHWIWSSLVVWSAKYFLCLFRNRFMFVLVVLTCSKHRNKPRNLCVGFMKQTEKQPKHCNSVLSGFLNSRTSDYERLLKKLRRRRKKISCHHYKNTLVQYLCKYISGNRQNTPS